MQRLYCRVEELALPTRGIQLSGEVLSTDEAASAELLQAEAVHRARNSHRLFKAAPMTPCVCREQQLETGVSNKRLKRTLESYSTAAVWLSRGCSVPRCHTRRQLCGWEPPGPDPHTTWRFSSARPRIALGYSRNKQNRKWPWTNDKSHGQRFFNTWSCLFSQLHHFGRTLFRFSPFTQPLGEHENLMECRYKLCKSWSQMIQLLTYWLAPPWIAWIFRNTWFTRTLVHQKFQNPKFHTLWLDWGEVHWQIKPGNTLQRQLQECLTNEYFHGNACCFRRIKAGLRSQAWYPGKTTGIGLVNVGIPQ